MEYNSSSVEELLQSEHGRREFAQEELAFEATEKIAELMELADVTKSELAKRIGKSKAFITQVLSGSRNMTVHTMADLAFALGYKITLHHAAMRENVYRRHAIDRQSMSQPSPGGREITTERAEHPAPSLFLTHLFCTSLPQVASGLLS